MPERIRCDLPIAAIRGELVVGGRKVVGSAQVREGGALLLRDSNLVERAEIIREKGTNRSAFFRGQVDKYTWVDVGSSYLPSEIIAAFLLAQLEEALKRTLQIRVPARLLAPGSLPETTFKARRVLDER